MSRSSTTERLKTVSTIFAVMIIAGSVDEAGILSRSLRRTAGVSPVGWHTRRFPVEPQGVLSASDAYSGDLSQVRSVGGRDQGSGSVFCPADCVIGAPGDAAILVGVICACFSDQDLMRVRRNVGFPVVGIA